MVRRIFTYLDLEEAFKAGYWEGWSDRNYIVDPDETTIHHHFEDWLRNFEAD
jgi:hypothetical protein